MDESLPLRRSTRNSVALKNEELTPRKKKVSTPVKVEPSTPSRRTRASSATPKKNLIEAMNTPKKTLPVLNEEENTATTSRTPAKKIKETSPKTPSRRRLVRENVSTPTRVSIDKTTKKPAEESNVTLNRPLTRAKRKTMGEIQVGEVIKTSEPEKAAQNKKDKPEADKNIQKRKEKSMIPDIDDKTNKSDGSKTEEESCLAKVPKVITDFKKQELKEAAGPEKAAEENELGTFTSKSPVRAEDVAISSPRKVPESCKSITEASLISDTESINSKNQKVASNSPSSEEKTDITPVKDTTNNSSANITAVPDILVTSPKKVEDSKDVGASNVPTSPQKVDDPKVNDIPNITITSPSPQKVHISKGVDTPNIVVSSPSPQKVSKSEDKSKNCSDTSSEQNTSPRKNDTNSSVDVKETDMNEHEPTKSETSTAVNVNSEMNEKEVINIDNGSGSQEVKCSSHQQINENNKSSKEEENEVNENSNLEKTDENNKTQVQANTSNVSSTKIDLQNEENKDVELISSNSDAEISSLHCQSPKKVDVVENVISDEVNEENTVQSDIQISSDEIPLIEKEKDTDVEIKNIDSEESNKTSDEVESNDNVTESVENKDVSAEKSAESDSKFLIDENNVSEMVANANEAVIKDDTTPAENESREEIDESKLISGADESFELNISDIDEINAEEVNKITSITPATEEPATAQIENEKSEKYESNAAETDPPSTGEALHSANKMTSSEVVLTEASAEDEKIENNCEEVEESLKESADKPSPVRHNDTSPSQQSNSDETKPIIEQKDNREAVASRDIENPPGPHDEPKRSPTGSFRFDCEISDDSRDSGIQHDESVRTFKSNTECPNMSDDDETNNFLKHKDSLKKSSSSGSGVSKVPPVAHVENEVPSAVEDIKETSSKTSPEGSKLTSLNESLMSANDFLNSEEESSTECEKGEESGSSPGKSSSEKKPSEDLTKTDHAKDYKLETEESTSLNITHSVDSSSEEILTDCDHKNKHDDCDVKKSDNSEIKNSPAKNDAQESQNNSEIKNSPAKNDVQESQNNSEIKNSPAKNDVQESQNNSEIKNSPAKNDVQESQNNSEIKNSPAKNDVQDSLNNSEINNSPAKNDVQESQNNSEIKNSPAKNDVQESQNNSEIKNSPAKNDVQESQNNSEIKNSPAKNDVQDSLNNSEINNSPDKTDEQECDKDLQTMNSPGKAEQKGLNDSQTTISPRKVGQKSLDDSQIISSPKLKVDNFIDDDPDSSESLDHSTVAYHDFIMKTTKAKEKFVSESDDSQSNPDPDSSESLDHSTIAYHDFIKKTTKSNRKIESESDGSQSDGNSELSIPSNAATEGSSDGPLTGRDFIEFEAEEGEETEEGDDSFIVQSSESSSEASSDTPNFNMKLRKRRKNLDTESLDRQDYTNSVKTLVDSSEDDKEEDNFIKNKKQKLERNITVNKKTRRPKSILINKETVIESLENININKSKTDIKVVKEPTKIGAFIISSISQDSEEPKLPRKTPKSSKIHSEPKKSTISQKDCVPMGFNVSDADDTIADDAALRGFVVSYDEPYLVAKKPRKEVNICSESISKKKKIKEGKIIKKAVKKSLCTESKEDNQSGKESPFVVTLILPLTMKSSRISSVLSDLGINDISSITFPKPKIATVEFSNKEPFKKLLELYGELKYNDKPIYILEGCSVV